MIICRYSYNTWGSLDNRKPFWIHTKTQITDYIFSKNTISIAQLFLQFTQITSHTIVLCLNHRNVCTIEMALNIIFEFFRWHFVAGSNSVRLIWVIHTLIWRCYGRYNKITNQLEDILQTEVICDYIKDKWLYIYHIFCGYDYSFMR